MGSSDAPKCPYCRVALAKRPQRKTKCSACGKPIFVKSTPGDRTKRLMTEAEANKAEAMWQAHEEQNKYVSTLQSLGLSEEDLEKESNRLLSRKSKKEVYSALLERVAKEADDLHRRKMAHHFLAIERSREGKDFLTHLKEAARCELLRYQQQNIKKVEILTAGSGNSCTECEKQSRKIYPLEQALKEMPLPCPSCTHTGLGDVKGFCRCTYVASF